MSEDYLTFPNPHFSGSYAPEDVQLLLTPMHIQTTPIHEKEHLIQSGLRHYSEMLSEEQVPDAGYMELFQAACAAGVPRLAREINLLSALIRRNVGNADGPITLCSLIRAGLPYGVLLQRNLRRRGCDVRHYGVSIIRDRGLDAVAMSYILKRRPASSIVFVDGWTGKGAIAQELRRSWNKMIGLEPILAVVADPGGVAQICASREDWLIPSGMLGANVSGLISRSIFQPNQMQPDDFHGCMLIDKLAKLDVSRSFVDRVEAIGQGFDDGRFAAEPLQSVSLQRQASHQAVAAVAAAYDVANENRIKPGIAEATRAILRRKPYRVLVRRREGDPDLAALLHLCNNNNVQVLEAPDLIGPYRAITIIEKAGS
jgi:hypothetical protein